MSELSIILVMLWKVKSANYSCELLWMSCGKEAICVWSVSFGFLCSLKAFFYDSLCDLSQDQMKWSTLSKSLCAVEILNELRELDEIHVCLECVAYVGHMLNLCCSFSLHSLLCYYFAFFFQWSVLCDILKWFMQYCFVSVDLPISVDDFWMLLFGVMCTFSLREWI